MPEAMALITDSPERVMRSVIEFDVDDVLSDHEVTP
jgi:hypothetical protein